MSRKLTREEFIEKAKKVHGDKYDYSKVEYVNVNTKVNIICLKHGIFSQRPVGHLIGQGCPKCSGTKKLNTEEFIERAKKVHRDKYDYSEVVYVNNKSKVNIFCPKHGIFSQTPSSHLVGQGCSKCGYDVVSEKKIKWDKESCYKEAKKYEWLSDYIRKSSVAYTVSLRNGWLKEYSWLKKKIKEGDNLGHVIYRYLIEDLYVYIGLSNNIDSRKRYRNGGWQRNDAVYKKCKELDVPIPEPTIIERCKSSTEAIEREIYWIKYYREVDTRYEVLNRNRGGSLGGLGCTSQRQSKEQFINKAKKVHGNKYDYSEVVYVGNKIKVSIICPKHGMFLQTPNSHLRSKGCPECGKESRIEKRSSNTEDFIEKAKKVHGDKYDYSEVVYVNSYTKVNIKCPKHGVFLQTPASHLIGNGCKKCGIDNIAENLSSNTEDFINKAKNIHGDKYDYSEVEYVKTNIKVNIICPKHGIFSQTPSSHLVGHSCPKCYGNNKSNTEDFIIKAKKLHGDKYDYSEVEYINANTKVNIICSKHGIFSQTPESHLIGHGCLKCGIDNIAEKLGSNTEDFIEKAKKVHGDKFDYSKVEYVNSKTKVKIICSKHGMFLQSPNNHLRGNGCAECGGVKKLNTEYFIRKAKKVHGDKYDYSEVEYINANTKVNIICSKHGMFLQRPADHLMGVGCSECGREGIVEKKTKWNKESCYTEAKKYEWLGDFFKNSRGVYKASLKNGWLKDYVWLKKKYNK